MTKLGASRDVQQIVQPEIILQSAQMSGQGTNTFSSKPRFDRHGWCSSRCESAVDTGEGEVQGFASAPAASTKRVKFAL